MTTLQEKYEKVTTYTDHKLWPAPGIYAGIPAEQYHALDAASSTFLKLLAQYTPKKAKWKRDHDEQTDPMALGEAMHTCVLEPERFMEEYMIRTPCQAINASGDNKGKVCGKESKYLDIDDVWKCGIHCRKGNTPKSVTQEEYDGIMRACESIHDNAIVRDLITPADRETELSLIWVEKVEIPDAKGKTIIVDQLCKARLDIYHEATRTTVDLKKAIDASDEGFVKAIGDRRYDIQSAWYMRGATMCFGEPHDDFFYVAVEVEDATDCQAFKMNEEALSEGRIACQECLQLLVWCTKNNKWPGYPQRVKSGVLPAWLKAREAKKRSEIY